MKHSPRSASLLACGLLVTAPFMSARANVLGDIHRSISSLWGQKERQQSGAKAALKQATAKKHRAEFLEDRLEKTARLLDRASDNYDNYSAQLARTQAHIVETRHRVQLATARYKQHTAQFGLRLAALQKRGESGMLSVVLGSNSLAELSRRTSFLQTLSDNDAKLQSDLKADKWEVTRAQNALMEQWQDRVRLARAAHDEQARIEEGKREQQAVWREVNASQAALLRIADARQRASDSIGAQIQGLEARKSQMIAQYDAQVAREQREQRAARGRHANDSGTNDFGDSGANDFGGGQSSFNNGSGSQADAGAPVQSSGGWMRPASGRISSPFGYRYHPILHREKLHTGEDIAAGYGTPFRAARGGRVLYAGWQTAYGKTIIIDTGDGTTTLYGHASKLNVRAGQSVKAGQYIGNVGSTGWSTGPHLHFEVRKGGRPVNPAQFVR